MELGADAALNGSGGRADMGVVGAEVTAKDAKNAKVFEKQLKAKGRGGFLTTDCTDNTDGEGGIQILKGGI